LSLLCFFFVVFPMVDVSAGKVKEAIDVLKGLNII
jgi:hypothetical protein